MPVPARSLATLLMAVAVASFLLIDTASAQIPPPPAFVFGSISDADGEVPEGVVVEAIVNNNVCGTTETVFTGDGDSRVTVYAVDIVAHGQTEGCGRDGDPIRIRVGDRLASGAVPWETGFPIRKDIVFGNATPVPIPTFTPTPEGAPTATPPGAAATATGPGAAATATQAPSQQTPAVGGDDQDAATAVPGAGDGTPTSDDGETPGAAGTATATLEGELTDATPIVGGESGGGGDGGGGIPVWATLLAVLGGIVAVGGGIGYFMSRSRGGDAGEVYDFGNDGDPTIGEEYDAGPEPGGDRIG